MARETGPEAEAGRDGDGIPEPGAPAFGLASGPAPAPAPAPALGPGSEGGPDEVPDEVSDGASLAGHGAASVDRDGEASAAFASPVVSTIPPSEPGAGEPEVRSLGAEEAARAVPDSGPGELDGQGDAAPEGLAPWGASAPDPTLDHAASDGGDLRSDREGPGDGAPDARADVPPDLGPRAPAPEDTAPLILPGRAARAEGPGAEPSRPALAPAAPAGSPPPLRRRGGFGAMLLGGLVAAALGFGAAWLARDRLALPDGDLVARLAALEARPAPADPAARLGEVEARLAALEEEVAAVAAAPAPAEATPLPDLAPLREDLAAASEAAEAALAQAGALDDRLAALEARPVDVGPAVEAPAAPAEAPLGSLAANPDALREEVLAAVEPRLATLEDAQASLDLRLEAAEAAARAAEAEAQTAEAEAATAREEAATAGEEAAAAREEAAQAAQALAAAQGEAEAAARRAEAGASLTALSAALEAGEPLGPALGGLEAAGTAPPPALAALAETGAPTLAALREAFPEAARAALAAAREAGLTDEGGGLGAFLRRQLSVRSTAPREGADPDAVLARAEAALDQGRLSLALQEVGALPEPARAAMADWIAGAEARAAADAALADLRGDPAAPAAPPTD